MPCASAEPGTSSEWRIDVCRLSHARLARRYRTTPPLVGAYSMVTSSRCMRRPDFGAPCRIRPGLPAGVSEIPRPAATAGATAGATTGVPVHYLAHFSICQLARDVCYFLVSGAGVVGEAPSFELGSEDGGGVAAC